MPTYFNLGCGIPGQCYTYFMDGFDALDKSEPYDNGLTFKNVTKIEYETSHNGTAIQIRFVKEYMDMPIQIVSFAAIENSNGLVKMNKGWEMTPPYEIG